MSDNPFAPPQSSTPVEGVLSGNREDLRSVAKYQKGVLICILVQLVSIVAQFLVPPQVQGVLGIGVLVVGLVGAVFVFLLSMKTYGTGLGILLGILALAPCIGLIVLLIVNGKATKVLKQNGIQVGLLGANTSAI